MAAFSREIKIRFQHCDPAGIVFYPRYYEMFNQMVEDWFAEGVGMSFQAMHHELNFGVPLVHAETDFRKASRIGEVLIFSLELVEIGTKSFQLRIQASFAGEVRVETKLTLVCVTLGDSLRAIEIPGELRTRMEPFLG